MNKFHIALSVSSIAESIEDYSQRLGTKPEIVIDNQYALWRTDILNLSIRQEPHKAGQLRHIGFEDQSQEDFVTDTDCNGILWEYFSQAQQIAEIQSVWPDSN